MNKRMVISNICTAAVVALMVGCAQLLGEKEIIFPEITALAVGAWIAPKQVWRTNRVRIFLLIALFSVFGVCVVRFVPLPLYAQIIFAFLAAQAGLAYSGTSFAPVISAAVLPVVLQTTSWVYPIAAVALTGIIVLTQWRLEKAGLREAAVFEAAGLPERSDWIAILKRTAVAMVLAVPAVFMGLTFLIAPPLLVAFTELSNPECGMRKCPVKAAGVIIGCGFAGAVSRLVFTQWIGMPVTVSAVIAVFIMLLVMNKTKMFLPPAGAVTILAMLVPAQALWIYPFEVAAGFAVLMFGALAIFKNKEDAAYEADVD